MKQITIYDLLPLLKNEEWKPLLNGKFFISNFGRVYSSYSKGIMKPFETKRGYLRVNLFDKGKKTGWLVHRLVALEFIPNVNGCEQINHKDCNKQNNRVENLEWCSAKENSQHAWKTGLYDRRKKMVLCLETGKIYSSIKSAKLDNKIRCAGITKCIRGKQEKCGGLHWQALKEMEGVK